MRSHLEVCERAQYGESVVSSLFHPHVHRDCLRTPWLPDCTGTNTGLLTRPGSAALPLSLASMFLPPAWPLGRGGGAVYIPARVPPSQAFALCSDPLSCAGRAHAPAPTCLCQHRELGVLASGDAEAVITGGPVPLGSVGELAGVLRRVDRRVEIVIEGRVQTLISVLPPPVLEWFCGQPPPADWRQTEPSQESRFRRLCLALC